jgi:hypothetical protein
VRREEGLASVHGAPRGGNGRREESFGRWAQWWGCHASAQVGMGGQVRLQLMAMCTMEAPRKEGVCSSS